MPEDNKGQEPEEQPEGNEPEGTPDPEPDTDLESVDDLPGWAQNEIRSLRDEAAKRRNERNDLRSDLDTLKQGLAQALGLGDDEEPDPERLSDEVEQWRGKYRRERLRNLVSTVASDKNAHASLTWALLSEQGAFNDVDLEAEDLESTVSERVQEALTKHPELKASSGSADQGPRGSQPQTDDMNALLRAAVRGE